MGRNHQRVLHGLKPLKAGYYNKETGKWQRMPPDPRVSVERLGLNLEPSSEDESGDSPKKPLDPDCVKARGRFFCELCNVSATSQDQLDGHITGQRHLKAVRLHAKKTSATSTGKYYCSPCDLTLNSESQFAQHVESKKHKTRRIKQHGTMGKVGTGREGGRRGLDQIKNSNSTEKGHKGSERKEILQEHQQDWEHGTGKRGGGDPQNEGP
ncbi:Zinc finger protein 385B [Portunus trituberculatus]|uniref:Zinc finger protein 385B n=1 Tax=Portunus trituberculatus TaxID=210409 RepID=A0A5B7E0R3_PORTR|nr:Zinc finger protein 385B [Portunus trituberculatus]